MRAAGYVRPGGEPDVPALHRTSGIPDSILRRWLAEGGEASLDNLRVIAPALGLELRDLVVAAGLMSAEEVGLSEAPKAPVRPPSQEERIMADDVLSEDDKSALIHMYRTMRERNAPSVESRPRK